MRGLGDSGSSLGLNLALADLLSGVLGVAVDAACTPGRVVLSLVLGVVRACSHTGERGR